jgi:beta-phosphoglucomutase
MLRAVIFDMDGVIVDSHPVHKKAWRKFLEFLGKETTEEDLNFIMEGRKREEILQHFLGELSQEQLVRFGQQKEQLFRQESVQMQPISGLRQLLQELERAKIRLAVASSGSSTRVNNILRSLDLRRYFRAVVTGDQVANGKPDPAIFRLASRRLRVCPGEALVFEDSVSGVKAAKAAGMTCVGVATNGLTATLLHAGADSTIADFSGVSLDVLRRILKSSQCYVNSFARSQQADCVQLGEEDE